MDRARTIEQLAAIPQRVPDETVRADLAAFTAALQRRREILGLAEHNGSAGPDLAAGGLPLFRRALRPRRPGETADPGVEKPLTLIFSGLLLQRFRDRRIHVRQRRFRNGEFFQQV